jgi:antitoxin (DNA-binding transcriptional repressor) of toxin-antitoxin stability system
MAMDDISITFAKDHLEDLIVRARRGEDVRIVDPTLGAVRVIADTPTSRPKRVIGQWKELITVPARLLEPLSDDELRWLSGEESI